MTVGNHLSHFLLTFELAADIARGGLDGVKSVRGKLNGLNV